MHSAPASDTAPGPGPLDPLAQRYLDHVRFEKRLADRTCTLYRLDLERLSQMAQASSMRARNSIELMLSLSGSGKSRLKEGASAMGALQGGGRWCHVS